MNTKDIILYSFRRCPYAMRARMALRYAGIEVEIREVDLKNKPSHMLEVSPKGTVPVMIFKNGKVIDESLDIMYWALKQNDPDHWLSADEHERSITQNLILKNDTEFKMWLNKYKYADRHPEQTEQYYQQQAEQFLQKLEALLSQHTFLIGEQLGLADIALLPFIRQFAHVDREWFDTSGYQNLRRWLDNLTGSDLFIRIMRKI